MAWIRGTSLSQTTGAVTGIVLAGGRSSRFGSDKLVADLRGMPLLHHAVLRSVEVTHDVVVVIASGADEPSLPPGVGLRFVRDPRDGEGPLAGLLTGLGAAFTALALVTAGDMPDPSTAVLLEMLRVAGDAEVDAVSLQDGDRSRPLPLVVRTEPAREAAHTLLHGGERRLRALLEALRTAVIDETTWVALDPGRGTLHDVDTPDDLLDR
jgi:molybdopterin-guanine dinucleotide biosynthesis protein A